MRGSCCLLCVLECRCELICFRLPTENSNISLHLRIWESSEKYSIFSFQDLTKQCSCILVSTYRKKLSTGHNLYPCSTHINSERSCLVFMDKACLVDSILFRAASLVLIDEPWCWRTPNLNTSCLCYGPCIQANFSPNYLFIFVLILY